MNIGRLLSKMLFSVFFDIFISILDIYKFDDGDNDNSNGNSNMIMMIIITVIR